ncbi:MAG: NAD-dependent deacylase [Rhodothermales bacterium]|nr:NAD-dependent deacylase [Rhodothermales bacterium]
MPDVPIDLGSALDIVVERLAAAQHVVVLTGAGVSAESGLPTFRDALTGHWAHRRPEELATATGFADDPEYVQAWYRSRLREARYHAPNAGHLALADLQRRVPRLTLVTQNVDGFHQKAGSTGVLELHGNLESGWCFDCGAAKPLDDNDAPVHCDACDGYIRPGVVWFGEALPVDALFAALAAAEACDVLLAVGTSGVVYPAASLPGRARQAGAFVAEINPVPSALSDEMDALLTGPGGTVLPELVRRLNRLQTAA